ncbi:MAG: cyclopropane-fatty-acyl-phospholipid synthase family protein [Burkholderiales bacterium]
MHDATSLPVAATPPGIAASLASFLRTWSARSRVPFRVVFADGTEYRAGSGEPAFTLRFKAKRAELMPALFGHTAFLEAYFAGDVDVDGNLALAFRAAMDAQTDDTPSPLVRVRNAWHEFRFGNGSIPQAQANAQFHYDLPYEFYAPWLDRAGMLYTCAYWKEGTSTLEEAQVAKMDHVCRKVQLAAGETFVDVGCGFGGLLFHAHEKYGARGTGINAASRQLAWLRGEVERRGLANRIGLVECDFRQIPGQYDKLLSIGTLEHAGRDQLDDVIRGHAAVMKPGALGVIHFIGHVGRFETEFYIRKHIFPGGWIPSLAEAISAMERHGLEVIDVENLRRHYALTLDAWATRFDASWDGIRALDPQRFDERFRRTWRTYLWSCAEMFRSPNGRTHLFQVVVSKGNATSSTYPMSRAFLYG